MNSAQLLDRFCCGITLTNKELLQLENDLEYYDWIPSDSWHSENLSILELRLLKKGAYSYLLQVRDMIEMRKNKS